MTASDDSNTDTALAISRTCAEEPDMRTLLERTGDTALLDQFLAAVRHDEDLTTPINALHTALQRSGDARGLLGAARTATPWGMGQPHPADIVLLCPRRRCSRTQTPATGKRTHCTVFDEPLRAERI